MTQRCRICDIAHEETSRCPTDMEYERGYRSGMNQKAKELEPIKRQLEAAYDHERQTHARLSAILGADDSLEKCAARLTQRLAEAEALLREATEDREESDRMSDLHIVERDEALQRLAAAEAETQRLRDDVADLEDCREHLRRLGEISGCDHCDSSDERSVQVSHIKRAFDRIATDNGELREMLQKTTARCGELKSKLAEDEKRRREV